jgi:hypothetical protein
VIAPAKMDTLSGPHPSVCVPSGAPYDYAIRNTLRNHLICTHAATETLLVDELGVCHGAARLDLATVNGSIHGFEIKSAFDSLLRLKSQTVIYGRVCDEITLVCASEHLRPARALVPGWWGLVEARCGTDNGTVDLVHRRRTRLNPNVEALAVIQLLWRDEIVLELAARGFRGWTRKPVQELERQLVAAAPLRDLQEIVRRRLRERPGWPRVGQRLWG